MPHPFNEKFIILRLFNGNKKKYGTKSNVKEKELEWKLNAIQFIHAERTLSNEYETR